MKCPECETDIEIDGADLKEKIYYCPHRDCYWICIPAYLYEYYCSGRK